MKDKEYILEGVLHPLVAAINQLIEDIESHVQGARVQGGAFLRMLHGCFF